MFILDKLITLPLRGAMLVFEKIHEEVENELNSEERVLYLLKELQFAYEQGGIAEEDFYSQEEDLLKKWRRIRENKIERGE